MADWVFYIIGAVVSVVISAVSYGVQAALAPNPRKPILSGRIDQLRQIARNNVAPLRVVYGTYRASGVLLFARSVGEDGKEKVNSQFLHFALALAHGPIDDISDIQLNDEPADSTRFKNLVAFIPFVGFRDQAMFRGPITLAPVPGGTGESDVVCQLPEDWLKSYRPLREVAYLWGLLRANPDVFPGGAPNVRVTMRGRQVYDPRDAGQSVTDPTTWRWSNNWALCIRDFLTSTVYGFGIPQSEIDDASVITAANVSDQLINAPSDRLHDEDPMPQIARYTIDGLFESDEVPIDVLSKLLVAGNGALLRYGDKWHLKAGTTEAVATDVTTAAPITLTEADLRDDEDIQITRLPGRKDRINTIRGTFINPAKQYLPDQFPPVTNATFIEQDGNVELGTEVQYDFTQHTDRASYLAAVFLKRQRLMQVSWPVKPGKATQLVPLARIKVTHAHFGWSAKDFQIRNWERQPNGAVTLQLEEYADATWDQDINPAKLPVPTNLPGPFDVDPPTNVVFSEGMQTNPDGTHVSKLVVTWTAPTTGLVEGYEIRWRGVTPAGTLQARRIPAPATRFEYAGLAPGLYIVDIASTLNVAHSTRVVGQVEITYQTAPPPDPIDVRVQQAPGGVRRLTWRYATERPPDLWGVELRWLAGSQAGTLANWDAARFIKQTRESAIEITTPTAPGTYTYLLRSVDTTALYSNGVATVVAIIEASAPDVILERAFDEEGWPLLNTGESTATGQISNGSVNSDGHLEGYGGLTWDELGSWDSLGAWNAAGGEVAYTSPIIDLGSDRPFRATGRWQTRQTSNILVQLRTRKEAEPEWSPWQLATGGVGRYVQVRIRAFASTAGAPIIEAFSIRLQEGYVENIKNDLAMTGTTATLTKVERTTGDWNAGPWQLNVLPVLTSAVTGIGSMQIDPDSALEFDGSSTGVDAIDHADLRLQGTAFVLEAQCKVTALSGLQTILTKGTDWRLRLNNAALQFLVDGSLVLQTAISDAVPIHHIAVIYGFGRMAIRVDGQLAVSRMVGRLTIPSSSAVVRLGYTGATDYLHGSLQRVRLWSVPRTSHEVTRDAGVRVDPAAPGLIADWRFDDASGTTVRDYGPLAANGTVVGAGTWVRIAYRESPPIPLGLLPSWRPSTVMWSGAAPGGTSVAVQMSTDDGASWTAVQTAPTAIPGMTVGEDPTGKTLRLRQSLRTTTLATSPRIDTINVALSYARGTGDLVVVPGVRYAEVVQAYATALQGATVPPAATLLVKDPAGARFKVFRADTGAALDVTAVDVEFRGIPLAA